MVREQVPLGPLTTLGVGGPARYLVDALSEKDVESALALAEREALPLLVMGGGSNLIIHDCGFPGVVLRPNLRGLNFESHGKDHWQVRARAGETWDTVVSAAVERGLWGIENLSAIPGNAGGAVIQNIGAYGQEIANVIDSVVVYDFHSATKLRLDAADCAFAYRRSLFNHAARDRYVILELAMTLTTKHSPNLAYAELDSYLADRSLEPTLQELRNAVITIRKGKFPSPSTIGTAGSFFKNPRLTPTEFAHCLKRTQRHAGQEVAERLRAIGSRFTSNALIKLPAAFLIDQVCDLKGQTVGGAQVSPSHALAIINPNFTASSKDVLDLVRLVRSGVHAATGLRLELEPCLVGFEQSELDECIRRVP